MEPVKTNQHQSDADEVENIVRVSEPFDALYTVEDVSRLFKIKPSTVRAMARRGDLPSIRVGRMIRFNKVAIMDYIQSNQVK